MIINRYFDEVSALLPTQLDALQQIIQQLIQAIENGSSIWIIGNGGSASTANHFEVDLSYVRLTDSTTIKAKSLCSNTAVITAIGNDIGFENVFSHQILRQGIEGDICFAISASGNSPNLIKAFGAAKSKKMKNVALLGFDGGHLKTISDFAFVVESEIGKYGQVEDVHLALCHFLAASIKSRIFGGH